MRDQMRQVANVAPAALSDGRPVGLVLGVERSIRSMHWSRRALKPSGAVRAGRALTCIIDVALTTDFTLTAGGAR